jgi:hypothetical protein
MIKWLSSQPWPCTCTRKSHMDGQKTTLPIVDLASEVLVISVVVVHRGPTSAAGEVHGHVKAIQDGDVIHVSGVYEVEVEVSTTACSGSLGRQCSQPLKSSVGHSVARSKEQPMRG